MTEPNPALLARFREWRAKSQKDWARDFPDCSPVNHTIRYFPRTEPRILDWEDVNDRYVRMRAVWSEAPFTFVAEVIYDEDPDPCDLGKFTDTPDTRGRTPRQAWKVGVYDRKHAPGGYPSRQFRYAVLEDYRYEDERKGWSDCGASKSDAHLLAVRAYQYRVKRLLDWGNGEIRFYGVKVKTYLMGDTDLSDCLAESRGLWGIEDWDAAYMSQVALEEAEETLDAAEKELNRRGGDNPALCALLGVTLNTGWDQDSQLLQATRFIAEKGLVAEFAAWLTAKAEEEENT